MLKRLLTALPAFLLILASLYGCQAARVEVEGDKTLAAAKDTAVDGQEEKQAPPIALLSTDGKMIRLSDYKGKKVVINFWTTWCPPCREELPELQSFYREMDKRKIAFLGVNVTAEEASREDVQEFLAVNGVRFPVLLDEKGEASRSYQIVTIPTTVIIDEKGNLSQKIIGPVTKKQLNHLTVP